MGVATVIYIEGGNLRDICVIKDAPQEGIYVVDFDNIGYSDDPIAEIEMAMQPEPKENIQKLSWKDFTGELNKLKEDYE